MSQQIRFFKKNKADLSNENVAITVSDTVATNNGQDFVDFVRNRNNTSAWVTTGSTDAANTSLVIDFVDIIEIRDIILVGHNFKVFTIQYWNGSAYADFPTPINETVNDEYVSHFITGTSSTSTSKIKIIITGAQTVDADKVLRQLIATEQEDQFNGWFQIKKPTIGLNKKRATMLSGKANVVDSIGKFSCTLEVKDLTDDDDLTLLETIFFKRRGSLIWLCGGDEEQFSSIRIGYRKEDIYLVRPINEWTPEFYKSLYSAGIKAVMQLEESID